MTGHHATFEQKLKAAHMLVEGHTQREVGEEIGIARTTVNRWVNSDPEFLGIMHEIRGSIMKVVDHRLIGLADTAVSTLADVCENGSTDSARVSAAKEILARLVPGEANDTDSIPPNPRELLGDEYESVRAMIRDKMTDAVTAES